MSRVIQKGATDRSVILRAIDSTDGTPETGFAYNTAGIDLWYRREGGAVVSITEATLAAVDSAHSDGGVIHLGNGYFRLDAPDAAFATGANHVFFGGTATGMIIIGTEIQLVNYNPEDAVRLGLTALPNAAADAAGGLPISDAGALDLDARLDAAISTRLATSGYTAPPSAPTIRAEIDSNSTKLSDIVADTNEIQSELMDGGRTDLILDSIKLKTDDIATAAAIVDAMLDELLTGHSTPGSVGISITDTLGYVTALRSALTDLRAAALDRIVGTLATGTHNPQSGDAYAIVNNGIYGNSALETLVDGIETTLAAGVTVTTNNDKTGYSLTVTPPTAAQVRAEIDSNSTQLAAIVADTAEIQAELADGGRTDLILDAILGDTAELQTDWANGGRLDLLLDAAGSGGDATAANQTTIINAINALNDISTSDVLTQAASALNTYDPPTKAELDVAIAAVAGLTGSYARVITVQDGLSNNVIAANVEVWDSGNTTFYQRLQTNSSGQVTFNMDAGTYTIRIFKEGYSFADATLVISGAGSTTYNMTPFTTPTASNVSMCRVYGYFMTPEGGYYATLTPSAVVEDTYDSGNNFFKGDVTGGYVAGTGLVYWDIVRGATARVRIPEIGYEAQIIVPALSSSELDDLV